MFDRLKISHSYVNLTMLGGKTNSVALLDLTQLPNISTTNTSTTK